MDITAQTLLLAFGLGLLGFVEPCTVGTHMLFIGGQTDRPMKARVGRLATFATARLVVMGGFGGGVVFVGQRMINAQTGAWLVFGAVYLALGCMFLAGRGAAMQKGVRFAPQRWKAASSPLLQGFAFGLNIPACAAPILFALMGVATATGSPASGFLMMAVFALALSLPLVPFAVLPHLARIYDRLRLRRRILGWVFVALGLWSIWFGLFVDPADWSGI